MRNLIELLEGGEPERKPKIVSNGLKTLHITEYAYEKAYAYARLACKKAKGSIECGGYLIAPKDAKDRIATDSFLAKNQDVRDGLFTIEAKDVIEAGREVNEMGYKVLGWWHSHGNTGTFFSKLDDDGQKTVLNEIGAFNYIAQIDTKEVGNLEARIEDGRIVMFDKRNPGRRYEIEVDGDPTKISIAKLILQQEKRIGFAYGLVVNNVKTDKKPYIEIATREICSSCKASKYESVRSGITFFNVGEGVIDEKALMNDIKKRVKMKSRFFSFGRGKYKGSAIWARNAGDIFFKDVDSDPPKRGVYSKIIKVDYPPSQPPKPIEPAKDNPKIITPAIDNPKPITPPDKKDDQE